MQSAFRQWRHRITLGQTGIDKPQPGVLDPERPGCGGHFGAAHGHEVIHDLGIVFEAGIKNVAAFTASAGDNANPVALGDILRHGAGPLTRLVIRMGMHCHHPHRCHLT